MNTFKTIFFTHSPDKTLVASKHPRYFSLWVFGHLLSKPFGIVKLRELLRDVAVFGNDLFNSKTVKSVTYGMGGTADYSGNLVCIKSLVVLGREPFLVFKQGLVRSLTAKVLSHVFSVGKKNKIFKPVVMSITVNVMNFFVWFKETAKMFFYDKSMFENITSFVCGRMFRDKHFKISSNFLPAAFPSVMLLSTCFHGVASWLVFSIQCIGNIKTIPCQA